MPDLPNVFDNRKHCPMSLVPTMDTSGKVGFATAPKEFCPHCLFYHDIMRKCNFLIHFSKLDTLISDVAELDKRVIAFGAQKNDKEKPL